ncbi:uncharacterized protein METZ01_LOCUS171746, partial [marine metagenome]
VNLDASYIRNPLVAQGAVLCRLGSLVPNIREGRLNCLNQILKRDRSLQG